LGWRWFWVMNSAWYLNVSRNVTSQSSGGLRAGRILWKAELILMSKTHVG
jgi:hypothetical protein